MYISPATGYSILIGWNVLQKLSADILGTRKAMTYYDRSNK